MGRVIRCLHLLNHGRGWGRRRPNELDYRGPGHDVVHPILVKPLDATIRQPGVVRYFHLATAHKSDVCHGRHPSPLDSVVDSVGSHRPRLQKPVWILA
jgi:hypothetical protein